MDRLVHDRAPHPLKLHHHSGSLVFPLREGRPLQMHLECGGVPVHFVHAHFRIVVFRQQNFELQGARFIFQASLVRRGKATTSSLRPGATSIVTMFANFDMTLFPPMMAVYVMIYRPVTAITASLTFAMA